MTILVIAGALFGLILGRFFKVYVLVPTCVFAIVLALTGPDLIPRSLSTSGVALIALIASLQFGYAVGLLSNRLSAAPGRRRPWASDIHAISSRTLHVR